MADERKHSWWRTIAAVLLVGLLVYAASYLYTGETVADETARGRFYKARNIARFFIPAAWVEAQMTRKRIAVGVSEADLFTEVSYIASPVIGKP